MPSIPIVDVQRHADLTIVVPVRNESNGIIKCIDSILAQDFQGTFNIVIVDDHSTDDTAELVRRSYDANPAITLLLLSEQPEAALGKKAALTLGISEATGEIIVTTDGDCVYLPLWLTTLSRCFTEGVQIVTGPVVYPKGSKMLAGFQSLDLLSLIIATAAGIQSRSYFLGNGANLAFTKSAFVAVNGYTGNDNYVSGDDLFLIQKITEHFGIDAIIYAKSPDAMVLTHPPDTLRTFLSQRMRWASKNDALRSRRVYYLWMFLWAVNTSFIVLLILGVIGYLPVFIVGALLYIKMLLEAMVLYRVARYFNMQGAMRWFPWAFFLNILYVVSIGLMAVVAPSFEWKGRLRS